MLQRKIKADPFILGGTFVVIAILVVFPLTLLFLNSFKFDGAYTLQN